MTRLTSMHQVTKNTIYKGGFTDMDRIQQFVKERDEVLFREKTPDCLQILQDSGCCAGRQLSICRDTAEFQLVPDVLRNS